MGLVIFVVFVATAVVLFSLIALGRISFGASMIIFGAFVLIFLIVVSLFGLLGRFLKVAAFLLAIAIALAVFSRYTASGLVSLVQWLNKDTRPAEKEKRKPCPACGSENIARWGQIFTIDKNPILLI